MQPPSDVSRLVCYRSNSGCWTFEYRTRVSSPNDVSRIAGGYLSYAASVVPTRSLLPICQMLIGTRGSGLLNAPFNGEGRGGVPDDMLNCSARDGGGVVVLGFSLMRPEPAPVAVFHRGRQLGGRQRLGRD